ncbi:ABC transporter substrate-binding protein [[Mycobacterium] kokjensenii]|uniref:ABC transporter substrate-binding protein n=1 Tax=[Mycobacterium] kokjensenii TaxID=3064287 RepID=A0ABM9LI16_9MYCO|nr:ABC transporter substrate-binding protein [Mycolicibacter sp. MU0083]CAJ1499399.1 ABC transporter substrate-binding protein [Mycolicibacter sp. MU0083]
MKKFLILLTTTVLVVAGCSLESAPAGDSVDVVIGYQSKTINTATAGTLLRARGYLERRLADITGRTGTRYRVDWQDYDTGAPITAQMLAEKIDIGSMGDYPMLINGVRTQGNEQARTAIVSLTAYHRAGALNMVVVRPDSDAGTLADLAGAKVSASVGSAGHGTLMRALAGTGTTGVEVLNQQPQVGAAALESGQIQGLSQFVAWPGLLVYQDRARLLYDGAELDYPTLHGVVVRRGYAQAHPEVLDAFLQAQLDATEFLNRKPLEAARIVAEGSGLPQEVVYLYNGPGGTSFDTTLKPELVAALKNDVPYLKSIGDFDGLGDFDVDGFVEDGPLRAVFRDRKLDYDKASAALDKPVTNGGELWLDGSETTVPVADSNGLLDAVRAAEARGDGIRAAYVHDAELGTRWFADKSAWVRDGVRYLAFDTASGARRYAAGHPGAVVLDYRQALAGGV